MLFYKYIQKFIFIIFLLSYFTSFGIEICDNSIDDDGDGLVDLNDTTDCTCLKIQTIVPSLIPNPSFESRTCCPTSFSQLNCSNNWIQASSATTDYQNTCGFVFPAAISTGLLPFPDGEGIVGGYILQDYKEYLGACLLSPMQKDTSYTIRMSVASSTNKRNDTECGTGFTNFGDFFMTLYGSNNCSDLPFSGQTCVPSNWMVLGKTKYTPINRWGTIEINFTPTVNINTVIIGSSCELPASYPSLGATCLPYFYYDNLLLNQSSLFSDITKEGRFCDNNLVLKGTSALNSTYQWYLDGKALIGQKNTSLNVSL
jgi:hypothetical protein